MIGSRTVRLVIWAVFLAWASFCLFLPLVEDSGLMADGIG